MKKGNQKIYIIGILLLVLVSILGIMSLIRNENLNSSNQNNNKVETDATRFAKEYEEVDQNNVFVYRDAEEIIKILENGTGIVYLGFPECKWCQRYVTFLNEVAKAENVEKIYYYNILEAREKNTNEYQQIVKILEEYLQYDEEGNKRVYVPSVIAVHQGEIVGFDDETSLDTNGKESPDEYWTEDEIKDLKEKLTEMIQETQVGICTDCNK